MTEAPPVVDSTVAYLGPAGTHSHLAAIDIFGPADRHGFRYYPARSLPAVLSAVADGRAGWGVVPYFNTTSGPVRAICPSVIDVEQGLLAELDILACVDKQITHDLVGAGHVQEIRRVYSKREALDQCRSILATTLPHAKTFEESSTAEAVHRAEREGPGSAAIASRLVLAFHPRLTLLHAGFQDNPENVTQFLVVRSRMSRPACVADCLPRQTWIVFTSAGSSPILGKLLAAANRWGIGASAISGTVLDPYKFEMRFLLELHWPADSFKVRFFLTETSHLRRKVIGSPIVCRAEDREAIELWIEAEAKLLAAVREREQRDALAVVPPATKNALATFGRFRLISHEPVSTMETVWQVLGVVPRQMVNTQVLRDVATDSLLFCCVPGDCRVDIAKVCHALGSSFRRLTKAELASIGQRPGAISPLTAPSGVRVLVDESLSRQPALFMGSGQPGISVMIQLANGSWPIPTIQTSIAEMLSP